jgi:hypothetical protein
MSGEESERRTRAVVEAFKEIRKPGMARDELERLMRAELQRRGLLPDNLASE